MPGGQERPGVSGRGPAPRAAGAAGGACWGGARARAPRGGGDDRHANEQQRSNHFPAERDFLNMTQQQRQSVKVSVQAVYTGVCAGVRNDCLCRLPVCEACLYSLYSQPVPAVRTGSLYQRSVQTPVQAVGTGFCTGLCPGLCTGVYTGVCVGVSTGVQTPTFTVKSRKR
jgi:hypothetical protein